MAHLEESFRRIFSHDYPLVIALANNEIPIPTAYRTTFEYVLNSDLIKCFQPDKINIKMFERTTQEITKWKLQIDDPGKIERLAGESIFKELKRIANERDNFKRIDRLNRLFPLLRKFKLLPILYKSQNLYFEISKQIIKANCSPEWIKQFAILGDNLGVKVE
jgi:hypothetical protein